MSAEEFLSSLRPGELSDLRQAIADSAAASDDPPAVVRRIPAPVSLSPEALALDREPDGTVVVDREGVAYQKEADLVEQPWYMAGSPSTYTTAFLVREGARVVWRPDGEVAS